MSTVAGFITRYRLILSFILLGVIIRLVSALVFNHIFDFRNILAMMKSVADTGNITEAFYVLKKQNLEVQLYGKIYYQIGAAWLWLLHFLKIININYIFAVEPFTASQSYLAGLGSSVPPLYQLTAIKLSQFLYDFLLLYFMFKTAFLLNIQKKWLVVLFWALNPYLIFTSYAMYQSDLAMIACLMGGVYFTLKSLQNQSNGITRDKIMSLILFAAGAIIKQVPILIIPFVIVLYSKKITSFFIYSFVFIFSYLLLSQPWSSDAQLFKLFFLTSRESLALFNFNLNGVPIFLIFYLSVFTFIFLGFKEKFYNPVHFLTLVLLVLTVVYISEDNSYFFPQFNVWIFPFMLLMILIRNEYSFFLLAPIVGFIKRSMIDNNFFTGGLSQTFDSLLESLPRYNQILQHTFNTALIDLTLNTVMTFLYILLILFLLSDLDIYPRFKQRYSTFLIFFKKHYVIISVVLLLSYYIFLIFDYQIKTRMVAFSGQQLQETGGMYNLNSTPVSVVIHNPEGHTITTLQVKGHRSDLNSEDYVMITFTDMESGKQLLRQKFSDHLFPTDASEILIPLKKSVNSKKMRLHLEKTAYENDIYLSKAKTIIQSPHSSNSAINVQFDSEGVLLTLRGKQPFQVVTETVKNHVSKSPSFFLAYTGLIITNLLLLLYVIKPIELSSRKV